MILPYDGGIVHSNTPNFYELAQAKLSKAVFDHIEGGAGCENTINNNLKAFQRYEIKELSCTTKKAFEVISVSPIAIAPMAFHQIANPACTELDTAMAASKVAVPIIVPIMSTVSLETIAEQSTASLYLQMHLFEDLEVNLDLVKRAEASSYAGIVLSVDVPFITSRPRDIANNFNISLKSANLIDYDLYGEEALKQSRFFRSNASWDDLVYIISCANIPVYLKGLMHESDVANAKRVGAKGIIVSNHGGRQRDNVVGTIDTLPDIVKIKGELDVWVDGGIRSGQDIFIALALGAKKVLVGRPILWALAVGGQSGVESLLRMLFTELTDCMKRTDCMDVKEIHSSHLIKHEDFQASSAFLPWEKPLCCLTSGI